MHWPPAGHTQDTAEIKGLYTVNPYSTHPQSEATIVLAHILRLMIKKWVIGDLGEYDLLIKAWNTLHINMHIFILDLHES